MLIFWRAPSMREISLCFVPHALRNFGLGQASRRTRCDEFSREVKFRRKCIIRAVLHQSPDKRGVPLPVKMVSQLTQTWHSQVRSFC